MHFVQSDAAEPQDPLLGHLLVTPEGHICSCSGALQDLLLPRAGAGRSGLAGLFHDGARLLEEAKRRRTLAEHFRLPAEILGPEGQRVPVELEYRLLFQGGQEMFNSITVRARPGDEEPPVPAPLERVAGLWQAERFAAEVYSRITLVGDVVPFGLLLVSLGTAGALEQALGSEEALQVLLGEVAERLLRLRHRLPLARLAPDRVIALVNHAEELPELAERALRALTPEFQVGEVRVRLAPALALACFPRQGRSLPALLDALEAYLPATQRSGEIRQAGAASEDVEWEERREGIRGALLGAVASNTARLVATPVLHLASGLMDAVEVALSLRSLLGLEGQLRYLPDFLNEPADADVLSEWMVEKALAVLAEPALRFNLRLTLRVAQPQLLGPLLPALLSSVARRYGLAPGQLSLLVRKDVLFSPPEPFARQAQLLAGAGIGLWVDSYRGLLPPASLRAAGIVGVRLPPALTDSVSGSSAQALRSLGLRCRVARLEAVLSGVGSREALEAGFAAGIEYAQGPHIGGHVTLEGLVELLEQNRRP